MRRIKSIISGAVFLAMLLTQILVSGEEVIYYINPAGGKYYHSRKDCESIQEKYRSTLVEISADQLDTEPYSELLPCPLCVDVDEVAIPAVTPANPYVMGYYSPYDTATQNFIIEQPGKYHVGDALSAGIYTAKTSKECDGILSVATETADPLYSYQLQGETSYTFYLGDGMSVTLPEHCTLQGLIRNLGFQNPDEKTPVSQARYTTMSEIPGSVYFVTNIDRQDGYYVISTIQAEIGEESPVRVDISDGEVVQLVLQYQYDVFVEFVNCIVWPAETGEG